MSSLKNFNIQVDENTRNQAALLHNDIPGYDLPSIDFVQTTTDKDEDVSILDKDNLQIYAHLDNVLVHMIDNQQIAIFKSNQDFNKNKEKISQYIKYAENWQVASVICSYTVMACDVLLIIAMIVFLFKYRKTMQAMLAAFLQINTKNTGIQSVQADQIGRTYPPLFTLNLPKEEEIMDDLREITAMEYVVQVTMIDVCIDIYVMMSSHLCRTCRHCLYGTLSHTCGRNCNPFGNVAVSDTYQDNISDRYSIPDEIPSTLAFSSVNWCKIYVFTSNILVLHHEMSQTVKINVNRYTNIYLLMNLFKINQFIFIFSCISALFSFIQQTIFLNHFVFLLLLIV